LSRPRLPSSAQLALHDFGPEHDATDFTTHRTTTKESK
jgi:hypothetical protein